LAESSLMPHLATLELGRFTWSSGPRGWRLGDEGAKVLAASPAVHGLSYLGLTHAEITDAGAAALAEGRHWRPELWLNLQGNPLTARGQQMLRERFGERVEF
jgi:hypothetical protein